MANLMRGLIVIGIGVLTVMMFALPFGARVLGTIDAPVGFLIAEVGGIILFAGLAILVFDISQESAHARKTSTRQSSTSVVCRKCGRDLKELPQDAKFCSYCGSSTVKDEETKIY
jgi:ribosomal protein L37E